MAKLLAALAILAILYLLVADASTSSCTSSETCQEQIQGKDLGLCKSMIITQASTTFNPLNCCRQLGEIEDIPCQCDAIKGILKEAEEEGHDTQETVSMAQYIVVYCRMGTPQSCLYNAALSSIIKGI